MRERAKPKYMRIRGVLSEMIDIRLCLSFFLFRKRKAKIILNLGISAEMELRVGGRFRLGRKIGSGSFGDIYLGIFDFKAVPNCLSSEFQDKISKRMKKSRWSWNVSSRNTLSCISRPDSIGWWTGASAYLRYTCVNLSLIFDLDFSECSPQRLNSVSYWERVKEHVFFSSLEKMHYFFCGSSFEKCLFQRFRAMCDFRYPRNFSRANWCSEQPQAGKRHLRKCRTSQVPAQHASRVEVGL